MSGVRLLVRGLVALAYCELVGVLIAWHSWLGKRSKRASLRHAAALVALSEVSEREAKKLDRIAHR